MARSIRVTKDSPYDLTSGDLARMLRVDLKTVHNWVKGGLIEGVRTQGRHLRFCRAGAVRFMRRCGHPIPDSIGAPPVRVLCTLGRDVRRPSLGKGVEQAGCDNLFTAVLELASGRHEVLVVDLDAHGLGNVVTMVKALRERTPTRGVSLVGLSRRSSDRMAFVAQGGDVAIVQSTAELAAAVRWVTGRASRPPSSATLG